MSWISDVKLELKQLDTTKSSIRKFALPTGCILIFISVCLVYKNISYIASFMVLVCGLLLFIMGIFLPLKLKRLYKVWMAIAFNLGWIVSRVILFLIFYFIVTPIALTGRLLGKEFIARKFNNNKKSYWIKRDQNKKIDYEKMF
jgi:hypothetical protein